MMKILVFGLLVGVVFSADELLFSSQGSDFSNWYFDGNFQYNVQRESGISKNCHESFTEAERGHLYSPVIDIHPLSDISISIEFSIWPCQNLKTDDNDDKFSLCVPLLKLSYIILDTNEEIFIEVSDKNDIFEPVEVGGLLEEYEEKFKLIDSLSDKYENANTFTTRNISLSSISKKIQFKIDDDGTCFVLRKFLLHRQYCAAFTNQQQYFDKTYSNRLEPTAVTGKCIKNSVSSSDVSQILCDRNGNWMLQKQDITACLCNEGHEPTKNGDMCNPCQSGYFKGKAGNHKCNSCPRNSKSIERGAHHCSCYPNFMRPGSDLDAACTQPLTGFVKILEVLPFDSFILLQWQPVESPDSEEPVKYEIQCSLAAKREDIINSMTVTDKHSVVMNGFRPNGYYVCLVKAFNRVTDKESVVYTESEPFSTVPAIVAHSASTKKVSAEQHLFINWSPPERLEELKESAKTFYDTDYNVTGYRVLAKLDSSSGSSSRPSQSGGSGSDSSAIVAVIDTNTTYDLTVLFPSFNNQFDNVSFQIYTVHTLDGVEVNGTDYFNLPSKYATGLDNDSGGVFGGKGGSLDQFVPVWLGGELPGSIVGVALAIFLLLLFLCLCCVLCLCIHCRRAKKRKQNKFKYSLNEDGRQNGFVTSSHHTGVLQQHPAIGPYGSGHEAYPYGVSTWGYHPAASATANGHLIGMNPLMFNQQHEHLLGAGDIDGGDIENNYDDLDTFQRETGAPTDFVQNNISKSQLSCKEQIGKGRFSTVFRARYSYQERHGGPLGSIVVAVKEPSVAYAADFKREIEIMAKIKHHNIVRLIGIVQPTDSSELQQIVMEYMDYGSLEQYLHCIRPAFPDPTLHPPGTPQPPPPLSASSLLCILLDVANAMDYLHNNNFVHRDLAARNVLVGRQKADMNPYHTLEQVLPVTCKLSDFGLCRSVDNTEGLVYDFLNSANPLVPIRWLAPEVAEQKLATFAGDVWSFSIVTWEVFSYGQRPYWKWDSANILSAVKDGYRLPVPPDCPLAVYEELLSACWLEDSTQRPLFEDIVTRIHEFLEDPNVLEVYLKPSNFNPLHSEAKELVLKSENSVERWLRLLKMEVHWPKFRDRNLFNLTQLTKMSYNQLKNDLGVQLVGNRRKIIQSIEVIRELQNEQQSSTSTSNPASSGCASPSTAMMASATGINSSSANNSSFVLTNNNQQNSGNLLNSPTSSTFSQHTNSTAATGSRRPTSTLDTTTTSAEHAAMGVTDTSSDPRRCSSFISTLPSSSLSDQHHNNSSSNNNNNNQHHPNNHHYHLHYQQQQHPQHQNAKRLNSPAASVMAAVPDHSNSRDNCETEI